MWLKIKTPKMRDNSYSPGSAMVCGFLGEDALNSHF